MWQIIWLKVKLYGGYVLAVLVAVAAVFMFLYDQNKASNMLEQMQNQSEGYKKQIEELRKVREEEARRHAQVEATYREAIVKIEADKRMAEAALSNATRQQIREIVEQTHDDPQIMAQRINTLLGIPIYQP